MPLLGGHLKGGLKAHELTRRSSPYDIMAILIFASPEGAVSYTDPGRHIYK